MNITTCYSPTFLAIHYFSRDDFGLIKFIIQISRQYPLTPLILDLSSETSLLFRVAKLVENNLTSHEWMKSAKIVESSLLFKSVFESSSGHDLESKSVPAGLPVSGRPEVTVCISTSLFVHTTGLPWLTLIISGVKNSVLVGFDAPSGISIFPAQDQP